METISLSAPECFSAGDQHSGAFLEAAGQNLGKSSGNHLPECSRMLFGMRSTFWCFLGDCRPELGEELGESSPWVLQNAFRQEISILVLFWRLTARTWGRARGTSGNQWRPVGNQWKPMGTSGNQWETSGNQWGTNGNQWKPVETSRKPLETSGKPLETTGQPVETCGNHCKSRVTEIEGHGNRGSRKSRVTEISSSLSAPECFSAGEQHSGAFLEADGHNLGKCSGKQRKPVETNGKPVGNQWETNGKPVETNGNHLPECSRMVFGRRPAFWCFFGGCRPELGEELGESSP